MKLVLLALALTPVQERPCKLDDVISGGLAVVICTEGAAKELERSGEPARDIALAAVEQCNSVSTLLDRESAACALNVQQMRADIRRRAMDAAITKVVRIRASRP